MAAPIEFQWNTFNEEYPSVFTVWKEKSNLKDGKTSLKAKLIKMFNEACIFLEPVFKTFLSAEACTLRRLLYKLKNQQRRWKWFNLLDKIQKCLGRTEEVKLYELLKKILPMCEFKRDLSDMEQVPNETATKLLLEKVVGLSKLCSYILELSQNAFILIIGNLQTGEFIAQNLIFIAIISRIWVLVRGVLVKLFSWYDLLRKFSLRYSGPKYFTMFTELPDCLSKWINLDVTSLLVTNQKSSKKLKQDILGKMFGSLEESSVKGASVMGQELNNKSELYTAMEACSEIDLGEPMSKDKGVVTRKKKKKEKNKKSNNVVVDEVANTVKQQEETNLLLKNVVSSNNDNECLKNERGGKVKKKKHRKLDGTKDDVNLMQTEDVSNVVKKLMYLDADEVLDTQDNVIDKVQRKKRQKMLSETDDADFEVHSKDEEREIIDEVNNVKKKKKRKVLLDDDSVCKDNKNVIENKMNEHVKKTKTTTLLYNCVEKDITDSLQENETKDKVYKSKKKKKRKNRELYEEIGREADFNEEENRTKDNTNVYECSNVDKSLTFDLEENRIDAAVVKRKKKKRKNRELYEEIDMEADFNEEENRTKDNTNVYECSNVDKSLTFDLEENRIDAAVVKRKKKKKYLSYEEVKNNENEGEAKMGNEICKSDDDDMGSKNAGNKSKKMKRKTPVEQSNKPDRYTFQDIKQVEERKILSAKDKKLKHKKRKRDSVANTKKLLDSKLFRSDEDELDDLFSCLE